jgi:hypothetical protein
MTAAKFEATFGSGKFAFTIAIDGSGWTVSGHDGTVVGRGLSGLLDFETALSEADAFITEELVPLLEAAAARSAAKIGHIDSRFFERHWENVIDSSSPADGIIPTNPAS